VARIATRDAFAQFKRCIDYFTFAIQSETRLAIFFGARRGLLLPVYTENLYPGVVMVKPAEDGARTNDSGRMNQTKKPLPARLRRASLARSGAVARFPAFCPHVAIFRAPNETLGKC
jgi:hypothetical protein